MPQDTKKTTSSRIRPLSGIDTPRLRSRHAPQFFIHQTIQANNRQNKIQESSGQKNNPIRQAAINAQKIGSEPRSTNDAEEQGNGNGRNRQKRRTEAPGAEPMRTRMAAQVGEHGPPVERLLPMHGTKKNTRALLAMGAFNAGRRQLPFGPSARRIRLPIFLLDRMMRGNGCHAVELRRGFSRPSGKKILFDRRIG